MDTYEALYFFKPFIGPDNMDNVLKKVEKSIQDVGGKVLRTDKLGRRRLAYEINRFKDGFMVTSLMNLPPDSIKKYRRACQLNEDIVRLTLLKMDAVAVKAVTTPRVRDDRRPPARRREA